MRTRSLMLIVIAACAFPVAAQRLRCKAPQLTFAEVLSFEQPLTGIVWVRVYDKVGTFLHGYAHDAAKPHQSQAFYPEQRLIATTASAGCVPGEAWKELTTPCRGWFKLPASRKRPLERILVEAPPGMTMEATLKLEAKDPKVQCTRKERGLEPGHELVHVVGDEMIELTVRGTVRGTTPNERVPFEYLYKVNMNALRTGKQADEVDTSVVAGALKGKLKGQGGGPSSENHALLVAKEHIATVQVPK